MLALTVRVNKHREDRIATRIITMPVGPLEANCYFVYDDAAGEGFIVDPGGDAGEILETVGATGARITAVLVTHGHFDHLGATAAIARAAGGDVCASAEVEMVLGSPDDFLLMPGMPRLPSFEAAGVDQVLAGGETLVSGEISIEVIATPGHSPGSLTYHAAGCLFSGDLLFRGAIGRVDLPGGSFDELVQSVRSLIVKYPHDTAVYTGHGAATTLAWEKKNNPFLTGIEW